MTPIQLLRGRSDLVQLRAALNCDAAGYATDQAGLRGFGWRKRPRKMAGPGAAVSSRGRTTFNMRAHGLNLARSF